MTSAAGACGREQGQERAVEHREVVAEPAAVLALAEQVCPSLNGAASFRLATTLEALDAGIDPSDFSELADVVPAWRPWTAPVCGTGARSSTRSTHSS